jgi:hypothetical protein
MRLVQKVVAVASMAAVGLLGVAGTSSASPKGATGVKGGHTVVTVAPATTRALLSNGIVIAPVAPAKAGVVGKSYTWAASFPVSGGSVNLTKVMGKVDHRGGLTFVDFDTSKQVTAKDFRIVLGKTAYITAEIPALHARAVVFDLNLSKAKVTAPGHNEVLVKNVSVTLASGAATALDGALGTHLFVGGLSIGTARTLLVLR